MQTIQKHPFSSVVVLLMFIFMLVLPQQVFLGAKAGLILWFQTILPTLLPFSVISNVLIETNTIYYISDAVGPVFRPFFRVSSAGVFAIVVGFLCGYPLGAKVITQLLLNKKISFQEADYLLSFCNNVSPVFIINYIVIASLNRPDLTLPILSIMIGSPILCSFFFRKHYKVTLTLVNYKQAHSLNEIKPFHLKTFNACLMDSFEMMVYLGGYIMLFSILFYLLDSFHFIFPFINCILPFLEITNGISLIQTFPNIFYQKLIFTLSISSFGGICALFQTKMVLEKTGLSIRNYAIKKLITTLVTSLLTCLYLLFIQKIF